MIFCIVGVNVCIIIILVGLSRCFEVVMIKFDGLCDEVIMMLDLDDELEWWLICVVYDVGFDNLVIVIFEMLCYICIVYLVR